MTGGAGGDAGSRNGGAGGAATGGAKGGRSGSEAGGRAGGGRGGVGAAGRRSGSDDGQRWHSRGRWRSGRRCSRRRRKRRYLPCPTTAGTACAVLPLGDSITEGYLPSGANGGYRVELFRQAALAGKNLTFVGTQTNGPTTVENRTFPRRHEGHGGYTIAGGGSGALAGTITDTAITMYHPNIVLLMIGTNDLNDNLDVSAAPTRLGKLIDEITTDAPSALVVVATIIAIANMAPISSS